MKKTYIIILLTMLLLTSCINNEAAVAIAIAETQTAIAAIATSTYTPTSTSTPTIKPLPTLTPSPTPTPTKTLIPSPTPDTRTIQKDSQTLLLTREELNYLADNYPLKPYYYMPHSSWSGPHTNSEVVGFNGQEKGNSYLLETGRIEGYYAGYWSDALRSFAPKMIDMYLERFETNEGAEKSMQYNDHYDDEYEKISRPFTMDEVSYLRLMGYRETLSSGKYMAFYEISYLYRNFHVMIEGYDEQILTFTDEHFDFDFVESVAEASLQKLILADLTE